MGTEYQAFYTESQPILSYMVELLKPQPGSKLLEPCAGNGLFVDAVLRCQPDIEVDAYEMNPVAIKELHEKYSDNPHIHVTQADTLLDPKLLLMMNMGEGYDYVIANPPYGAWQEHDKRKALKRLYPGLYVRETYSLFLYQALHLLKPGGRLVFIIPDTFLNLHMHTPLRRHLLAKGCVEEISLFPSSFFPGVNFGYSNLCILSLRRAIVSEDTSSNELKIRWNFSRVSDLGKEHSSAKDKRVRQSVLLESMDHVLFMTENNEYRSMITDAALRIGDIASCVTGFYSGCDQKFLRVLSHDIRNGKKYQIIDQNEIYNGDAPPLEGLNGARHFAPVVKGGGARFYKPDLWFMDWSTTAVNHYKTDSKARFQNSNFYFRRGVALPMVSSNKVTAFLMSGRLFDQSIVGVFPHNSEYLYYLLGFFNTDICTTLLRTINPSANNSANYVKKLPFVRPSQTELRTIDAIVQQLIRAVRENGVFLEEDIATLNGIYRDIYMNERRLIKNNIPSPRTVRAINETAWAPALPST